MPLAGVLVWPPNGSRHDSNAVSRSSGQWPATQYSPPDGNCRRYDAPGDTWPCSGCSAASGFTTPQQCNVHLAGSHLTVSEIPLWRMHHRRIEWSPDPPVDVA